MSEPSPLRALLYGWRLYGRRRAACYCVRPSPQFITQPDAAASHIASKDRNDGVATAGAYNEGKKTGEEEAIPRPSGPLASHPVPSCAEGCLDCLPDSTVSGVALMKDYGDQISRRGGVRYKGEGSSRWAPEHRLRALRVSGKTPG